MLFCLDSRHLYSVFRIAMQLINWMHRLARIGAFLAWRAKNAPKCVKILIRACVYAVLPRVFGLRVAVAGRRPVISLARALHGVRLVLPAAQQGLVLPAVPPRLPRRRLPGHDTMCTVQEVCYIN